MDSPRSPLCRLVVVRWPPCHGNRPRLQSGARLPQARPPNVNYRPNIEQRSSGAESGTRAGRGAGRWGLEGRRAAGEGRHWCWRAQPPVPGQCVRPYSGLCAHFPCAAHGRAPRTAFLLRKGQWSRNRAQFAQRRSPARPLPTGKTIAFHYRNDSQAWSCHMC